MMIEPIALISGVMPCRTVDQIYIGSVLSRPVRKNVTGISSNESVKAMSEEPMRVDRMFGSVTYQNVRRGPAPRSRRCLLYAPVVNAAAAQRRWSRQLPSMRSRDRPAPWPGLRERYPAC